MTNQRNAVKIYQQNECLWDLKQPQYQNRYAWEAAYKAITEAVEMETAKDVICKIWTLRNTYNNERMKGKNPTTSFLSWQLLFFFMLYIAI